MTQHVSQEKPKQPLEDPELGPKGPRSPYRLTSQSIQGSGSERDYFPGKPGSDLPKLRASSPRPIQLGPRRRSVSWLQAH